MRNILAIMLLAALAMGAPAQDNLPGVPAVPLSPPPAAPTPQVAPPRTPRALPTRTPAGVPTRTITRNPARGAASTTRTTARTTAKTAAAVPTQSVPRNPAQGVARNPARGTGQSVGQGTATAPGARRRIDATATSTTRTRSASKPAPALPVRDIPAEPLPGSAGVPLPGAEAAPPLSAAPLTRAPMARAPFTAQPVATPALRAPAPVGAARLPQTNPEVPAVPLTAGGPAIPRAPAAPGAGSVQVPTAPDGRAPVTPPAAGQQNVPATRQDVKVDVRLERIRVQRSKAFVRQIADADADAAETASWAAEMGLQIRVLPPKDWDVIEITDARIQQVLDQAGQPMPAIQALGAQEAGAAAPAASAATAAGSMEPLYKKSENGALVLLRTSPPPAATRSFQILDARIKALLGFRQIFNVRDIRSKVGTPILHNTGISDLVMEVDRVDKDSIDVLALSALNRVGAIEFVDGAGKKLVPYHTEAEVKEADTQGGHEGKVWHFAFTKLPTKIDMNLTLYPIVMPRNLTVKFTNVPLP